MKTTTKQIYKKATSPFKEKSNNRQKQSHTTTPSATKRPNKRDSTEPNAEKRICLLEARIGQLKQKVELLESSLIVAKNINSLLEKEADDLQQYQLQACIVVDGIKHANGETEDHIKEKV